MRLVCFWKLRMLAEKKNWANSPSRQQELAIAIILCLMSFTCGTLALGHSAPLLVYIHKPCIRTFVSAHVAAQPLRMCDFRRGSI